MDVKTKAAGYRELEHTADWELLVWAPTLSSLLEQAARGMYRLSGIRLQTEPRVERRVNLQAGDAETLLVNFLSELLYLAEDQSLVFDQFDIQVDGHAIAAYLRGAPIAAQDKEIKAVTYHNLEIRHHQDGLEVNIVFDV